MQAINAIFDGTNFTPKQPLPFKEKYEVIITFVEPINEEVKADGKVDDNGYDVFFGALPHENYMEIAEALRDTGGIDEDEW